MLNYQRVSLSTRKQYNLQEKFLWTSLLGLTLFENTGMILDAFLFELFNSQQIPVLFGSALHQTWLSTKHG